MLTFLFDEQQERGKHILLREIEKKLKRAKRSAKRKVWKYLLIL